MKIQTFSIVAGNESCNAKCPYCISKMTPNRGVYTKEPEVNWRNFRKACLLAKQCGTTTAMITGKGEPTLFPEQISKYMTELEKYDFPLIDLQTNGIALARKNEKYEPYLNDWYEKGMTTIALSIVHYDAEKNREIFLPQSERYIDIPLLTETLHDRGFSVRLSCIFIENYIDKPEKLENLISFVRENKVEQLTVRPMVKPEKCRDNEAEKWVNGHLISERKYEEIENYMKSNGQSLMKLAHDAMVYDVAGQNVCLSNCLTLEPLSDEIRQIIFFPDGHVRHDWQYEGAILL